MNWLEVMGVLTGATCVYLGARQNIWNWPIGIANNILFLIVFWHSKLYADAGLQIFYLSVSAYGWWAWLYAGKNHTSLVVTNASTQVKAVLVPVTLTSAAVLYFVLHRFTDSNVPLGDAVTTALSLTAQFMMSRKMLENWLVWIFVDVLYIGLYCYKHLYPTAILYAVFIVMCAAGYRVWQRSMKEKEEDSLAETATA